MKTPLISVVMAVYNRAAYLERSIGSLLKQTFNNWELIAIDDGSSDNSYSVLKNYSAGDSRIKAYTQNNIKLPLTRNRGIKLSAGEYITFLDSDDEYEAGHLSLRYEYMKSHPDTDLLSGGVKIIGSEYVRDKNNPGELIHLSKCIIGGTLFGKRKVFEELNGFKNISYSEDSEFWERAANSFNTTLVNYPTYIYHRETEGSITNSFAGHTEKDV
jgi:glycosyltransferase involved in cell wall biosynthesis